MAGLSSPLRLGVSLITRVPLPPALNSVRFLVNSKLKLGYPSFSVILFLRTQLSAGFRLFPLRSPLLRESSFLSFPPGT
jgi:hypothetical protein